ncbi:hypothetical protein E4U25_008379 [Claviceps purpurea]|nr:hypothetical protein E4U25_008379 [Claviceps purpurea]
MSQMTRKTKVGRRFVTRELLKPEVGFHGVGAPIRVLEEQEQSRAGVLKDLKVQLPASQSVSRHEAFKMPMHGASDKLWSDEPVDYASHSSPIVQAPISYCLIKV